MTHLKSVDTAQISETVGKTTALVLAQPFDLARATYAWAVRVGMIEHSLIGSARFGRDISSLEKMTLGPWARQV